MPCRRENDKRVSVIIAQWFLILVTLMPYKVTLNIVSIVYCNNGSSEDYIILNGDCA